jgi:hypothetical protein
MNKMGLTATPHMRNIERNGELLQRALLRLTELDQQAEQEQVHGRVVVEIVYRKGLADHVQATLETRHHK